MADPFLYPCFLGPYGENDSLLERLLVEFQRDHVYWRRNFHPEDPPAIPTRAAQTPEYQAFEARLRRELHGLSAALKRSVPFHSPRYLGHMVSDLLLPGLAAQFLALPYNPNNISADAAPVTVDLEIRVGLQLARMLGFPDDPARADCAFGHLCSGGTTANYQGLRLALALKAFPVALRAAAPPDIELPGDDWTAFNLAPAQGIELLARWQGWLAAQTPRLRRHWQAKLAGQRIETLGMAGFFWRHPELAPPCVLAPVTAHYSWSKAMKLLGLGRAQLIRLPEQGMRLDPEALETTLRDCARQHRPVLATVAVLGSTEFGTVDPVDGVVAARERWAGKGLGFSVHVDGAWGGYLATLFRQPDGRLRPAAGMRAEHGAFPSDALHAAFGALARVDSVTVDPHKLGHVPYGAGAFVCRDQRAMALLAEDADYVFAPGNEDDYFRRFGKLGRYVVEGSRPGTNAAAVYVTHQVLPLDHCHFGKVVGDSIAAAAAFRAEADAFAARVADRLHCCVPFEPDTNLVTLAVNPVGNRGVAGMNAFVRRLHGQLSSDPAVPLQSRQYFGSMTTLDPAVLGAGRTAALFQRLGLDPDILDPEHDDGERLAILRHTLMNPFLIDGENGISYIQGYFRHLETLLPAAMTIGSAPGQARATA